MTDTATVEEEPVILEALSSKYIRQIIRHLQEWQNVASICKKKPSLLYIKYATRARTEYIPALIKENERLKAEVKDLKEQLEC